MQMQMNDYFMSDTSEEEYRIMQRLMEEQRILTEARLALQAREKLKKAYDDFVKNSATETKKAIEEIKGELDTGIKGKARTAIEEAIEDKLPAYDKISG
ncbi:hypothetical protein ACTGZQ_00835 [Streptococcus suis]